jgi:hypothetical protein
MNIKEDSPEARTLEDYVDRFGLTSVLSALADICLAKAEHLRENWQDRGMALDWEAEYRRIDNAASKVQV